MHGRGAKRRTSSVLPRIPHVTHVSSRRTCQEVPYQGGSGGTCVLHTSCKKSSKRVPKKGPWTGRYRSLSFLTAVHFWILENQELKLPVDSGREAALRSSRQKSIIFLTNETHGQQIWMCSTDGKSASRNNTNPENWFLTKRIENNVPGHHMDKSWCKNKFERKTLFHHGEIVFLW